MRAIAARNRASDYRFAKVSEWPNFPFKQWLTGLVALGSIVVLLISTESARSNSSHFQLLLDTLIGCLAVAIGLFVFFFLQYWHRISVLQQQMIKAASIEQEKQFQLLFNLMPQVGWAARPDGFVDFYNKEWYEYTGTTYEQMQGWGWQHIVDPAFLPEAMERWRYSLLTGIPFENEAPLRRSDGVFRRFLVRAKPMLDSEGMVVRWVGICTDINERAAELEAINARLKDSEERLDLALQSSEMGAWELDIKSGATWHSLKHDQIFGYEHLQPVWTYNTFLSHVIPEDRSRVKQAIERASVTGDLKIEYRIKRNDRIAWILSQGKAFRNKQGEPIRMMGTVMDITERKEAEIAKERLASIVTTSSDAIIGKSLDGLITSWNKGAEQIYGYRESEVIGKPSSILTPPDKHDELRAIFSKVAQGQTIRGYKTVKVTSAGKLIDVDMAISPIKDREGNIVGASTITRDISEAKRAEARLRDEKDFSYALFKKAPDAILLVDSQGLISSLNSQAEKMFGYAEGELLGRPVEVLMPARFREHHVEHRQRYSQNPQARIMSAGPGLYAERKDGSEFPVDIHISPVKTESRSMTMAIIRDLTEQRKEEAERKKAEQALLEQDASLRNPRPDLSLVRRAKAASKYMAAAASGFAVMALAGCVLQIDVLRNPVPLGSHTEANEAVCLLLAGISLLLARKSGSIPRFVLLLLAGIIVAIAGITLCEWIFGWNAGIDQLIAPERLARQHFAPGRMPVVTVVASLILGFGLFALERGRVTIAQICSLGTFAIGLLSLLGHANGFALLLSFGTSTQISFPVSITLILLGAALLLLNVDTGIAQVLVSPNLGGKVTRRLLPLIFLLPATGLFTGIGKFTTADMLILSTVTILLFPAIVWLVGHAIDRLDREKDQAIDRAFARKTELEETNRQLMIARDQAMQASNLKSAFVANISHEL
jgi:PAS domain S-box-containing protein